MLGIIVVGAIVVIFVLALIAQRRVSDALLGGRGQTRLLQSALINGVPPDDIDRDKWIAYLQRPPSRSKLILHAAVVTAVMFAVLVDNIVQAGAFGWNELGNVILMGFVFALVYGIWGRVIRGSMGWDQPPKEHLLAKLKADPSEHRRDNEP
jgi:hypothetical protein